VSCLEKAINIKSIELIYYSRNESQQATCLGSSSSCV